MMQRVFLLCGVPGSGKSWIAERVEHRFTYVPHDEFTTQELPVAVWKQARTSDKPILVDCPFAERTLREELIALDLKVTPVFIVEHQDVIRRRYEDREKRTIPKGHITRALSIQARAEEWNAVWGTSQEILKHLMDLS